MQYRTPRNHRGSIASGIISLSVFLLSAAITTSIFAQQPGSLDRTFSGDGKILDGILHADDLANAVAIQSDSKIIVSGGSYYPGYFELTRYNPDGSLDVTFGSGGKITTALSGNGLARAVAIQPDGKIVAAGQVYNHPNANDFALARYNSDGSLDTSFGTGGTVTTAINSGRDDIAFAIAIQSDGKLVAAGRSNDHFALARYNSDGSLDPAFGSGGKVTTTIGSYSYADAVAIQSDGKIVAAGLSPNSFTLARYNSNGSLDGTFGLGGIVTTVISNTDGVREVVMQPDGKIVVAGSSFGGFFTLARYNSNGSLDTAFDSDGIVTTPIGSFAFARALAIQPLDGKLVAAGSSSNSFALARYNSNGSLDSTFGSGGTVTTAISPGLNGAEAVVIQPDGKIAAAGYSSDGIDSDFALVRYNPNGSLDSTFDDDGKVTADFGIFVNNDLRAVAIQNDGKVVAAGNTGPNSTAVARYNVDGSPDSTFGSGGKVTTLHFAGYDDSSTFAASIKIQPDGKLVVASNHYYYDEGYVSEALLIRYDSNGSLDATFDGDGIAYLPVVNVSAIALQPDGKIVATGFMSGFASDFAVVRLTSTGSLDTSFDGDGVVTTDLGGSNDFAASVFLQPAGTIVVAGHTGDGSDHNFAVVRYNSNGALDTTFDGDGKVTTDLGSNDSATSVSIQPDGKIIAAGRSNTPDNSRIAVVRYNQNGSLDNTFDSDGMAITNVGSDYWASAVATQSDGKITASGRQYCCYSNSDFALIRYNTNGSLDTTFGGGDGIAIVDFNNSQDYANAMALDGQGRAVVIGSSDGAFALARFLLEPSRIPFDFDGDGRADISVFRPSDSVWYLNRSTLGFSAIQFGISTDKIVPADFDGDGKADIAVFRDGIWWWIKSSNFTTVAQPFGIAGDIPVPADYTGDGRDELAVYRNGQWWAHDLSNNQSSLINFGLAADKPVAADYDGDGRVDQAVYRSGEWHINGSAVGYTVSLFGLSSDRPVVGDYDGDGKADLAVYRDGTWYLQQSTEGFSAFQWGLATDIPTPADYDGDGKADAAVYRDGIWYVLKSTGGVSIQQFGLAGDQPIESAYRLQ